MNGRIHNVLHHGIVGKQVKILEYQSKAALNFPQLLLGDIFRMPVFRFGGCFSQIDQVAVVHGFQQGCAAQQRGLAGAGGTDDRNHLALFHAHGNIVEHARVAKCFFTVIDFQQFQWKRPLY